MVLPRIRRHPEVNLQTHQPTFCTYNQQEDTFDQHAFQCFTIRAFLLVAKKEGDGDSCCDMIIGLRRWTLSLEIAVPASERKLVLCFRG